MKIGGLQKLTLLDYPDKMACIIFTEGCNLRCPFCHNASLVVRGGDDIAEDDVLAFLEKRKALLDGVVISGGEPLLHPETEALIDRIREMGYAIKLDTNGCFPDRLEALLGAGKVDYVAMDIKNSPAKYAATAGTQVDLSAVRRSIELIKQGKADYEFRTTVVKPLFAREDFDAIGEMIAGAPRYFLQKFKDSGDLIAADGLGAYSADEMNEFLFVAQKYVSAAAIRG